LFIVVQTVVYKTCYKLTHIYHLLVSFSRLLLLILLSDTFSFLGKELLLKLKIFEDPTSFGLKFKEDPSKLLLSFCEFCEFWEFQKNVDPALL